MWRPRAKPTSNDDRGLSAGYRSGLEEKVAQELEIALGHAVPYESQKLKYHKPARECTYTPDFILPNGIVIETKGRFVTADRQKHLLVKEQHPQLDLRFVFSNSRGRINKKSNTTYAAWCLKNGFQFADKSVPHEWLHETGKDGSDNSAL